MSKHKADSPEPRQRFIVALDVDSGHQALKLVEQTLDSVGVYKVGLQLFIQEGPDLVRSLVKRGVEVFLDLKLHDIPNTIAQAARSAAALGAGLVTVHCANGQRALAECCRSLHEYCAGKKISEPKLLAVTVLTSMNDTDLHGLGAAFDTRRMVEIMAGQAYAAGVRGFVASAQEAKLIKGSYPDSYLVTPGIRPAGEAAQDQARVTTPAEAIAAGADALVVGRPVTKAADPGAAARSILEEIKEAIASIS